MFWTLLSRRIPVAQLKDGFVYQIYARNSCVGIYDLSKQSFCIARTKMGQHYLFDELDWAVIPHLEIGRSPKFDNLNTKLNYLLMMRRFYSPPHDYE